MVPDDLNDGWEVACPEQSGFDPDALSNIIRHIEGLAHPDFHSLLIARNGRLVFEAYFNGSDAAKLHDIRSAGKSFTSTLVGIAIDQRAIPDVEARMLPYFADFRPIRFVDHRKETIRVRDLLMMMSGLDADDNDAASPGREDNMLAADDWIEYALNLPMKTEPGRHWAYAGANTMLVAGILQAAAKMPVIDFAKSYMFQPLGIESFHWETSPKGIVAGQGFLSLRGRDQLKLGQLFLNNGLWQGRRILSETWVREASRRQVDIPNAEPAGYGYQWWCSLFDIDTARHNCYFASGNGGNKIYVLPDLNLAVSMASSAYGKPYMHTRSHDILQRVVRAAV